MSNQCGQPVSLQGATGVVNTSWVERLTFLESRWAMSNHVMVLAGQTIALCFSPNGTAYVGTTLVSRALSPNNSHDGGFLYTLQLSTFPKRLTIGDPVGPVRRVLYPFGASPRVVR